MVDPLIRRLVEQVINSPVKLQLLLHFVEHRRLEGTATQIAQRIYRDIWSTREALQDMLRDGVLVALPGSGEPIYRYRPQPELIESITRLCHYYNEPIERDHLQRLVRETASYTPYRRAATSVGYEYI